MVTRICIDKVGLLTPMKTTLIWKQHCFL